jgi:hypothetical protein
MPVQVGEVFHNDVVGVISKLCSGRAVCIAMGSPGAQDWEPRGWFAS